MVHWLMDDLRSPPLSDGPPPEAFPPDYEQAAEHQDMAAHYAREAAQQGTDPADVEAAQTLSDAARQELDQVSYYDTTSPTIAGGPPDDSAGSSGTDSSSSDSSYGSDSSSDTSSGSE